VGTSGLEGDINRQVEVGGAFCHRRLPEGASMLADLDLLLIAVYCSADDLLPTKPGSTDRVGE
jgi:hypothetical protein